MEKQKKQKKIIADGSTTMKTKNRIGAKRLTGPPAGIQEDNFMLAHNLSLGRYVQTTFNHPDFWKNEIENGR